MIWIILFALALFPVATLYILSLTAKRPDNLGVHNGKLADCPASPNCVCTFADDEQHGMEPVPLTKSAEETLTELTAIIEEMRGQVITTEDNYVHAEFTSSQFRFVDDVEFLIDKDAGLIHFRSASRVGYSDLGVNRMRMTGILSRLD